MLDQRSHFKVICDVTNKPVRLSGTTSLKGRGDWDFSMRETHKENLSRDLFDSATWGNELNEKVFPHSWSEVLEILRMEVVMRPARKPSKLFIHSFFNKPVVSDAPQRLDELLCPFQYLRNWKLRDDGNFVDLTAEGPTKFYSLSMATS